MRRRLATSLSAVLLGTALLLGVVAVPAVASTDVTTETLVLAASGPNPEDLPGIPGMKADNPDNEFAPAEYEPNWSWRAGKVLLAAFLFVLSYLGLMYYLRVARPAARSRES